MKVLKIAAGCLLLVFGVAAPIVLLSPSARAQEQKSWPSPDEVVAKMSTKLSLTDDQKTKITPIIAERQEKLKALAADTSTPKLQKMKKMKSVYADSDTKINALLTDEQKQKYAQMQEEMREEMKERRGQKGNGPAQ